MPEGDRAYWNLAQRNLSSVRLAVCLPQPLAVFVVVSCWWRRECVISNCLWAHRMMSGQPRIEAGPLPFQRSPLADRRRQPVAPVPEAARAIECIQ